MITFLEQYVNDFTLKLFFGCFMVCLFLGGGAALYDMLIWGRNMHAETLVYVFTAGTCIFWVVLFILLVLDAIIRKAKAKR